MANIKELDITATVPWDWASKLPDSEAALFAGLLLNPVIGVTLNQRDVGYVPNEHGGQTATYEVSIGGREALGWPMLDRMVAALGSVGEVTAAFARDVQWDDSGEWSPLDAWDAPTCC